MTAKITFLGAHDTVTGSCTMLQLSGQTYLIDCGLFQGTPDLRQRNREAFPIPTDKINAIYLTHAHLDHTGYLPRLVKQGYRGPIFASEATVKLCRLLLTDAAYLEEEFAKYANETGYSHHKPALPLFTRDDVEKTLSLLQPVERHTWIPLAQGHGLRLHRAGHIPGASYLEFSLAEQNKPQRILFSGDIGNDRLSTMRAPEPLPPCEFLVMESTYGDRLQPRGNTLADFAKVVNRIVKNEGVLVIPAFAVGRAQEVTYLLKQLEIQKQIPEIPIILDSPMAIQATSLFLAHPEDHKLDLKDNDSEDNFRPRFFEVSSSADDSMLATMRDGPLIVISAAGMLSGGRILHHLKRRLPYKENIVLFTGYQAEGTKGRYLQDNAGSAKTLRIHHQEVELNARVETLDGLSSHADYQDILGYLEAMPQLPQQIFLNHGSPTAQRALAEKIEAALHCECTPVVDIQNKSVKLI